MRTSSWHGGYSIVELVVAIAVIVVITALGIPQYLSYQRSQNADGASRSLVATLNQARQLAVMTSGSYSVETQAAPRNQLRFCAGATTPCPVGTVWTGAGTNGAGWMPLDNAANIVVAAPITFTSLGGATVAGTFRVQDPSGTACRDVVVKPSGSIQIAASASCP